MKFLNQIYFYISSLFSRLIEIGEKYPRIVDRLLIVFILTNVFFASELLRRGDLFFNTDIARDFLLLEDLWSNGLSLIGPRASLNNFFHGPLWLYINFPVFWLSNGDPVMQGWFWYVLLLLFLLGAFWVGKKLFDKRSALVFTALLSTMHAYPLLTLENNFFNGFYNPHGALFLTPLYFYLFWKYLQSNKVKFLLLNILVNGALIQFEVAFGAPMLILLFLAVLKNVSQTKTFLHLFSFLLLPLPLATYLAFDIRHNFSLSRAVFAPELDADRVYLGFLELARSRFTDFFQSAPNAFRGDLAFLNLPIFCFGIFALYFVFQKGKEAKNLLIYQLIVYFYLGFFVISFLHNGWLLYFYFLCLAPINYLLITRFPYTLGKKLGVAILIFILGINFSSSILQMKKNTWFVGQSLQSWKFYEGMYSKIFADAQGEFGVIVRAPDIFGYGAKYPLKYWQMRSNDKKAVYGKAKTTYIILEPYKEKLWSGENFVYWYKSIFGDNVQKPEVLFSHANGYAVYKFTLTSEQVNKEVIDGALDWASFR